MDKSFLDYFKKHKFLALEDLRLLYGIVSLKKIKAGEVIINEGDMFHYAVFVKKGLLRNYIITSDGEDRTLYFASEGMQTTCPETVFLNKPSIETVEALEDSFLIYLDTIKFNKLSKKRPTLLRLKINNMEKGVMHSVERVRFFTVLSPEERFVHFRNKNPDLIQRIPQKYLASFLGVTTVSLSRIKSRITKKVNH